MHVEVDAACKLQVDARLEGGQAVGAQLGHGGVQLKGEALEQGHQYLEAGGGGMVGDLRAREGEQSWRREAWGQIQVNAGKETAVQLNEALLHMSGLGVPSFRRVAGYRGIKQIKTRCPVIPDTVKPRWQQPRWPQ